MEEGDLLRRIDGHLDRGNEMFERLEEELRLARLSREQSDAVHERLFGAFTRLTREIAERFDRAEERTERALERFDVTVRGFDATVQSFERKLDESIDESKAHRDALFRILERLGPDGSSAAA